jgi:uncharacterized protein (DUF1778 family)
MCYLAQNWTREKCKVGPLTGVLRQRLARWTFRRTLSDGAEDCLPQRFVVLFECVHERTNHAMPRIAVEDNSRMSLRIRATEKALLLRAVALDHTDLTDFVLRHALSAAKAVIQEADHVQLSERDSLRVLDLLENPPAPTASLLAATQALPQRS